ncbi:MAG: GyrI-like domain-containing protein, partial [Chloroflexi bacterium]|nr:GyrI-like domain-containing protein [Chloroflexota bacterium]
MKRVDLRKQYKYLYAPSAKAVGVVDVPPLNFLMIDGQGNPNTSPDFGAALEALYAMSYTLKFAVKLGKPAIDYPVMALEGLWWTDDMSRFSV